MKIFTIIKEDSKRIPNKNFVDVKWTTFMVAFTI